MYSRALPIAAILAVATATPLAAQHASHSEHATPGATASGVPTEPGDGAFAAIAEIVAILDADPETDWSRVDIDGLRVHLVDMNQLVLGATVRTERLPDGLRMWIDTGGRSGAAAARMVPAHSPVLADETGWMSEVRHADQEIIWTVTAENRDAVARLQALGFFGLMATGDHHRAHHLALARGTPTH